MCNPAFIPLGVMAFSAITQAGAAKQQASYNQAIARNNQQIGEVQAADAVYRGEEEAQRYTRDARRTVGAQRAAFSARGIDTDVGTAADLIDQTDFFGQTDAATARQNAAKDAWALRARGAGYGAEAAANSPGRAGALSLLGSAGSVASSWYGRGR